MLMLWKFRIGNIVIGCNHFRGRRLFEKGVWLLGDYLGGLHHAADKKVPGQTPSRTNLEMFFSSSGRPEALSATPCASPDSEFRCSGWANCLDVCYAMKNYKGDIRGKD